MSEVKVTVFSVHGQPVGYFVNPTFTAFPQGEFEVSGNFFDTANEKTVRVDFNPEATPYSADLSLAKDVPYNELVNVYVQRGRQPVVMTGRGKN
ncbi:MAG: hypothetical protein IAF58_04685 [Leptolyngbya sp.]|nr:hypothetical protein [Candidatus Melainabacteria bacterium]